MAGKETKMHSEISYLWEALERAQESENLARKKVNEIESRHNQIKSRIIHLEKTIREKDILLKDAREKIENLTKKLESDAAALDKAAQLESLFRDSQNRAEEINARIASLIKEKKFDEMKISQLEARISEQQAICKQKDELAEELRRRMDGILSLPEIMRSLGENAEQGEIIKTLSQKSERYKWKSNQLAKEVERFKADNALLKKKIDEVNRKLKKMAETLEEAESEVKEKNEEIKAKECQSLEDKKIKNELISTLNKLRFAYRQLKEDNSLLLEKIEEQNSLIEKKDDRIFILEEKAGEAKNMILREKENFAQAVKKIFSLQSALNEVKMKLQKSRQTNEELQELVGAKKASAEKVQALLKENLIELKNQKEINLRLKNRFEELANEFARQQEKLRKEENYSKELFGKLNEKQNIIDYLKKELDKMNQIEFELAEQKRENVKMASLLKQEQSDFLDKVINSLNKVSMDLRIMNVRIPPAARRMLAAYMKNLAQSVDLLKGWQQYVDQSLPSLEYMNLRDILEPLLAQWDKSFRLKRMKIIKRIGIDSRCKVNAEKLRFAFHQIIKNSYEEMIAGGTLTVTLGLSKDRKAALIKFEDTSRGLAQSAIENLYKPFNTTKTGHVGIGLVIAKTIARVHGGDFTIANRKQRGTVAEFSLPVAEDEGEPKVEAKDAG